MKRFSAAALLSLAVACCITAAATAALYPAGAPYLKTDQVKWVFHKATAGTGETLKNDILNVSTSCNACMVDSFYVHRLGATGATIAATQACTTAVIYTEGWSKAPSAATTVDSSLVFRISFSGGPTALSTTQVAHGAGDSLIVGVLVSTDGLNWNYANPVKDAAGADPIAATSPAVSGFVVLEAGGDGATYSLGFNSGIAGQGLPDRYNCWQWPMLKIVVLFEHAATVHNLGCHVTHWAVD